MIGSIALVDALGYAGTLVLGAVLCFLAENLLSPRWRAWRERRSAERAVQRQRSIDYAGRPFEFDGIDVGLQVLFGTLGHATEPPDVSSSLIERRWSAPPELREAAIQYAKQFGFYDGLVARLNSLDVETYSDLPGRERHRVRLEMMPTGYFDYLATNVALGPFTPESAPLLRGRGNLAETPLSNMVALDLTLVTKDGYVPVFFRSARMAGLERCWQTSSGETVQLQSDCDTDGNPDVFKTARRGLEEELHINPEMLDGLAISAIVSTPEFANIGVLVYATLKLSAEQLAPRLNRHVVSARDSWEYSEHSLLPIDDAHELAQALTDPTRRWTKQAAASIIFAHALRARGNVGPLAAAIRAVGPLSLEPGSDERDVLPAHRAFRPVRQYCWRCGSALHQSLPTICDSCGQSHYNNPKPCGEAVVIRGREVLLMQRAQPPWTGYWDVPGGFCEPGEHPMHAAERELMEELGLSGTAVAFVGTWMDTYGQASGEHDPISYTANSAYLIDLDEWGADMQLERDEVAGADWFLLDRLPGDLAFPDHLVRMLAVAADVAAEPRGADLPPDRIW